MSPRDSLGSVRGLKELYKTVKPQIEVRLREFRELGEGGSDEELFAELAFCILTPQSKARSCWSAIECFQDKGLLTNGTAAQLAEELRTRARFHNTKAERVVEARGLFTRRGELRVREVLDALEGPLEAREWLVGNVRGLGYKEASHFLRNIGRGERLSILDRHILRNLLAFGVIGEMPTSLGQKRYLEIERAMTRFSERVHVPLAHLDLLLWYKEAGEVFK